MRTLKILMTLIFGLGILTAVAVIDLGPAPAMTTIAAEAPSLSPHRDTGALVALIPLTLLMLIALRSPGPRATTSSSLRWRARLVPSGVVAPWAPPDPIPIRS